MRYLRAIIFVAVLLPGLPAWADVPPEQTAEERADLAVRLDFLETRIAAQRRHAEWWWRGFTAIYAGGVVVQSVRAAAVQTPSVRADLIISAVKATGGLLRFGLQPYGGVVGTHSFAHLPEAGVRQLAFKVERAEAVLADNAEATTPFGQWYAHVLNVVVNGAGALVVGLGFDDWQTGLVSAGIGVGMGELSFLTGPWEADADVDEYEARFGRELGPASRVDEEPGVSLQIAPYGTGLQIRGRF